MGLFEGLCIIIFSGYFLFALVYHISVVHIVHANSDCCLRISFRKFKRLYAIAPHKYKDRKSDFLDPCVDYIWNVNADERDIRRTYLYLPLMCEWLYVKWLLHKPDRIERRKDHIRAQSDFISHVREDLDSYKAKYEKAGSSDEKK